MSTIAYYRVSAKDHSIENQRREIAEIYTVHHEFFDEELSGAEKGENRAGFAAMMGFVRRGDILTVVDIDQLGRDSINVQKNLAELKARGVNIIITRLGVDLSTEVGGLMFTILSRVAEMERSKIMERANSGRERAKADGVKFGRPAKASHHQVQRLRKTMSITQVAAELGISTATVKRLQRTSAA